MKRFLKKKLLFLLTLLFITANASAAFRLSVKAELKDYKETSTYEDVMKFLSDATRLSDLVKVLTLTTSTEGRMVPLVILSKEGVKSPAELAITGKSAILIMANIHAGEVEGKEAVQMLIRDFVEQRPEIMECLENQVLLIIPIFNADGNDKMSAENRRDNGPEKAGVRANGQGLDLNRDYLKLETPEVKALVRLFNQWDPLVVVDMHTTNGSFHREPVTYTAQVNPGCDNTLAMYMWDNMFPAVAKTLKESYGYDSVPYGNFNDRAKPKKGWSNHAFNGRYGNNYLGLRNRFAILDENYSHADFKTRVLSSLGFIKSIIRYTGQHIKEMKEMVIEADKQTMKNYYQEKFALESNVEKLMDITLLSYEFKLEKIKPEDKAKYPPWYGDYLVKKTDKLKDYKLPYFNKAVPTRTVSLPEAYIVPQRFKNVIGNLKHHGIIVEKISHDYKVMVEQFMPDEIKMASHIYQGHIALTFKGQYKKMETTIPEGAYLVSMKQPLARLIPILLEPESEDSLAAWGFMNRSLMQQWRRKPNPYPILRIPHLPVPVRRYQD